MSHSSNVNKIVGYGVCGGGEADRYLRATLEEFKRLCDHTIIVGNNLTDKERVMIAEYGFELCEDDREWGTNQQRIKMSLMEKVAKLDPTYCVCLDMDEVFDPQVTKEKLLQLFSTGDALYFYIMNLWNEGWNRRWSFWNIRAWKWNGDIKFSNKPLHCGLAPEWCYYYASYAPHFIRHYGLMTKESRLKKIARYEKYDPKAQYKDKSYYDALHGDDSEPIDDDMVREALNKEIGVQKKKQVQTATKKKFYYMQSPDGRVMDIADSLVKETQDRGFKMLGEIGLVEGEHISYIGKFDRLWDEEYIARSFEELGVRVERIPDTDPAELILEKIMSNKPKFVLMAKLKVDKPEWLMSELKKVGIKTVCWIFDLYWDYDREYLIKKLPCFKADHVITTDGGHDQKWADIGVRHHTVRQGIYKPECFLEPQEEKHDVIFVGSDNPSNKERNAMLAEVERDFNFRWFGKEDTNSVRGNRLNTLFGHAKVVIGDSVFHPYYWSNRIVETLGRGGFLIHVEVPGLLKEYPYIITYRRGDYQDLKSKIEYYLTHDEEREKIIKANYEWVRDRYTCDKKCKEILDICVK